MSDDICAALYYILREAAIPVRHIIGPLGVVHADKVDSVKLATVCAYTASNALVHIHHRLAAVQAAERFFLDLLLGQPGAQVLEGL